MGRRSIFRFSLRSPPPPAKTETTPTQQAYNDTDEVSLPDDPEARYIPRQWAPNRLQTLYVTPSEQNLYLAAMAQLDTAPPPLPLWVDPAPILPPVRHQSAMDPTPPMVLSPPRRAPLRSPPAGQVSKLVTSPGMPLHGLSIREEFRSAPGAAAESASKEHALLALSDDAQLRFHNFPVDVLQAVQEALRDAWPRGRRSAHPDLAELAQKAKGEQDGSTWIVVLKGNVWRQSGKSELDSIRLILALLTVLSVHGWILVDRMQAAGVKYDNHNLLFAYSAEVQAVPPTYFAVSIPLPDRISLISPPPKATPTIISAVREAIESQTANNKRRARRGVPKGGERNSVITAGGRPKSGVEWDAWKGNIRLEGWVHQGVYRFWLGGMRRWLGNGVKWRVVEKLHPSLILTLINSLSAQYFTLLTSLPLLPLVKGRDILIFASQQSSGLTWRDTWKPQPGAGAETPLSRADSIVMITAADAQLQRGEVIPAEMEESVRSEETAAARHEAAGAMADERRQAAGLGKGFTSAQVSPARARHASLQPAPISHSPIQPTGAQHQQPQPAIQQQGVRRNASTGSSNPLVPGNVSSPRQRNLLVKKPSLKRDQPPSRSSSLRRNEPPAAHQRFASLDEPRRAADSPLPDKVHITSRHGIGSEHSEAEWTMIDPVAQQAGLGLSMYAPAATAPIAGAGGATTRNPAWNELEAPIPPPLPARSTQEPAAPPLPARPGQPYSAVPQPVITPINPTTHQPDHTQAYNPSHAPTHRPRPSIDSDRSIYVDAPHTQTPQSHPVPPTSFTPYTPPNNDTDSAYETPYIRDLKITNPTPPPLTSTNVAALASLDMPLSQPASPMKGRDAMVDVGQGFGAESIRGSVGYMPSLASQSMLGLTPAVSEGPILGAWDEVRSGGGAGGGGNVPMPMPVPAAAGSGLTVYAGGQEYLVPGHKGKKRESMRNMFGMRHQSGAGMGAGETGQGGDVNGVGSSRTKVTMGT